uniref:Uncharacterized protein n=1 Tax=Aegilops tauschii subsp. strangulata TaxID=200361 RepID=A0A453BIT3_AEGTS
ATRPCSNATRRRSGSRRRSVRGLPQCRRPSRRRRRLPWQRTGWRSGGLALLRSSSTSPTTAASMARARARPAMSRAACRAAACGCRLFLMFYLMFIRFMWTLAGV